MKELKEVLESDVKTIVGSEFSVEVTETEFVPTIDDRAITYPNLDKKEMKAKQIHTCVLYIDIRKSTELNLQHYPKTLTKLYGAFMRSMVKAAQHYDGKVRNIIGDRVMVVFDEKDCFKNAVRTAMLLNSVAQYILNKHFTRNEISCGIGIDYGRMLVSKGGIIKNGGENSPYKSLVWLGRPANVASKLTDLANKEVEVKKQEKEDYLSICYCLKEGDDYQHSEISYSKFFTEEFKRRPDIKITQDKIGERFFVSFKPFICCYFPHSRNIEKIRTVKTPPILMTEIVYKEYMKIFSAEEAKKHDWGRLDNNLYKGYTIYGGYYYYPDIKD